MAQAMANLKPHLMSGGSAGGVALSMPLPREQKEYVFRPNVTSSVADADIVEQQASQTSPIYHGPTRVISYFL